MRIPSEANFTRNPGNSGNSENLDNPPGSLEMFRIPRDSYPTIQICYILPMGFRYTLSAHTTRAGLGRFRQPTNLAETPKYFTNTGVRSRKNQNAPGGDLRTQPSANFTRNPENSENLDNPQAVLEMFRISRDSYPTIQI